jgi:NTP pyrophosphatase (non-canonical NTP hydrolase)
MEKYEKELYLDAINKWGVPAQIKMAIEECGELIVKLAKLDRNKNGSSMDDVIDEIVDVQIMIDQLKIIFGEDAVTQKKIIKLGRLSKRLEEDYYRRIGK